MHEMLETQLQSRGQEGHLEKEMATLSSILAWRIPRTEEPGGLHTVHGITESDMMEVTNTFILMQNLVS